MNMTCEVIIYSLGYEQNGCQWLYVSFSIEHHINVEISGPNIITIYCKCGAKADMELL